MPTPAETLETLLADFERGNPSAGANLRSLIETTPELETRMLTAIGDGHLDKFKPLDPALRARGILGGFDSKDDSIALPIDVLEASGADPRKANTLRMVFGHEIEHSIHKTDIARTAESTKQEIARIAGSPSPHDYTDVLRNHNDNARLREANDQIAGFNVLAAHVRRENPDATPEQLNEKLYASAPQMRQYFDVGLDADGKQTYAPKPGLTIGANGQIAVNANNIEAMGTYFYDRNRYPELYTQRNLGEAYRAEQEAAKADPSRPTPEVKVDLQALKLPGLALPPGFSDSSPALAPPAPRAPPESAPRPAEPATRSPFLDPSARSPDEPSGNDRAYFQMVRDRLPEQVPDHAVAHAVLQAKRGGLEADQVDPGKIGLHDGKIWIGANTPGFHVSVDPKQAPPMEQVQRELQTLPSAQPAAPAVATEEVQSPGGRSR
ncbi:hypothetical protein GLE_1085 [Lysobacter enzymogenes]|uniref:Uncharacterized protein n=1 Tax=Lysobacter enzymogenes TaxID=69 RepID=A0A0S2DD26_LYSEN|nr:hypothetical protein [Lysobacter enzymogenes]ALN56443.1 hypothetical protein GLE_1085 [Lysobacter enzymogenes]QCW25277.1 hypothetical protein FE772_05985 [Lysobacter enzymogenes]